MAAAFGLARGRRLPVLAGMVGGALLDLDKPGKHFIGMSPFPGPSTSSTPTSRKAGSTTTKWVRSWPWPPVWRSSFSLSPGARNSGAPTWAYSEATDTIGLAGGRPPSEPRNGRSEKLKMPPSSPTRR